MCIRNVFPSEIVYTYTHTHTALTIVQAIILQNSKLCILLNEFSVSLVLLS